MEELLRQVDEYLREHPEIEKMLDDFNISKQEYERYYLALTAPQRSKSFSADTSETSYNAEVSGLSA